MCLRSPAMFSRNRLLILNAGSIGLMVSMAILGLIAFGVAGVFNRGDIELMYVLWPSSVMLTTTWHTTVLGMSCTVASVFLNFLTYAAVAVLLRIGLRWILKLRGKKGAIRSAS